MTPCVDSVHHVSRVKGIAFGREMPSGWLSDCDEALGQESRIGWIAPCVCVSFSLFLPQTIFELLWHGFCSPLHAKEWSRGDQKREKQHTTCDDV